MPRFGSIPADADFQPVTSEEKQGWDAKAAGNHNHDLAYASIVHNHDASYEAKNANIQQHVASPHAPSNAQKNSDILKPEIEAVLTGKIDSHSHDLNAYSVADQTINAATTALITGSLITIPSSKLRIGMVIRIKGCISKTAAGTASNVFHVRLGTAGTVADTAILTFTLPVGTAVADTGEFEITVTIRGPLSASCIAQGTFTMVHNLASTGLATVPCVVLRVTSGVFNATTDSLKLSVSCTTAASTVLTFHQVVTETINL